MQYDIQAVKNILTIYSQYRTAEIDTKALNEILLTELAEHIINLNKTTSQGVYTKVENALVGKQIYELENINL